MKNQKLKATLKLSNKSQKSTKYVEDLLQEDDIDVCAVLNAKFRNPIKTWFASKLFKLEIAFKERRQKVKFFLKKLFKTDK
jgi:hypothetical protein